MPRSTYTKQQLDAQYEKLPEALKQALFSAEIAEKMFEIGKKHGLTVEKIGFAAEETGLVILGLLSPREFAASLSRRLDISQDAARAIAQDISHRIFFPLREVLKDTYEMEVGEEEIMRPAPAPARPASAPQPVSKPPPASPAILIIPPPPPLSARPAPAAIPPTLPPSGIKPVPVPPPAPPQPTPERPTEPRPQFAKPATPALLRLTPLPLMEKKSEIPIAAAPLPEEVKKLEPMRPKSSAASGGPPRHAETPASKPQPAPVSAQKSTERKPAPIDLRNFSADLKKEFTPLVGGLTAPVMPFGFLTKQEAERIVAEKRPRARPAASPPSETSEKKSPPTPTPDAMPLPPDVSPRPNPKIPTIDLRSLPKPPESPLVRTAESPPQKTPSYQGFDPYKEPVE